MINGSYKSVNSVSAVFQILLLSLLRTASPDSLLTNYDHLLLLCVLRGQNTCEIPPMQSEFL